MRICVIPQASTIQDFYFTWSGAILQARLAEPQVVRQFQINFLCAHMQDRVIPTVAASSFLYAPRESEVACIMSHIICGILRMPSRQAPGWPEVRGTPSVPRHCIEPPKMTAASHDTAHSLRPQGAGCLSTRRGRGSGNTRAGKDAETLRVSNIVSLSSTRALREGSACPNHASALCAPCSIVARQRIAARGLPAVAPWCGKRRAECEAVPEAEVT